MAPRGCCPSRPVWGEPVASSAVASFLILAALGSSTPRAMGVGKPGSTDVVWGGYGSQVITDLKVKGSRKGVSRSAIKKALGDVSVARVNTSLKKAVAAGKLIQDKESFKLAAPAPKKVWDRIAIQFRPFCRGSALSVTPPRRSRCCAAVPVITLAATPTPIITLTSCSRNLVLAARAADLPTFPSPSPVCLLRFDAGHHGPCHSPVGSLVRAILQRLPRRRRLPLRRRQPPRRSRPRRAKRPHPRRSRPPRSPRSPRRPRNKRCSVRTRASWPSPLCAPFHCTLTSLFVFFSFNVETSVSQLVKPGTTKFVVRPFCSSWLSSS